MGPGVGAVMPDWLSIVLGVVLSIVALIVLVIGAGPGPRGYSPGRIVDLADIPQPSPGPAPGAPRSVGDR